MSTVLTTPAELAVSLNAQVASLAALTNQCRAFERLRNARLADGVAPVTVKSEIDALLVPVASAITAARAELALLGTVVEEKFIAGSPPGIGWLRSGYGNDEAFTSAGAAQGAHMILYNDVGPNYDLFSGIKANDIIQLENAGTNDGRYTVAYDVKAKGTAGTASTVATYGPNKTADGFWEGNFRSNPGNWTLGTDWAIAANVATYNYGTTTPSTMTHALAGMTTAGLYTIQFDVAYTGGANTGTLKVDIGGGYYFQIACGADTIARTYSFVTNSPSTTPTLTFTATKTGSDFIVAVSNVYVYGTPAIFMVEAFAEDVGAGNSADAIVTLKQTAA